MSAEEEEEEGRGGEEKDEEEGGGEKYVGGGERGGEEEDLFFRNMNTFVRYPGWLTSHHYIISEQNLIGKCLEFETIIKERKAH